MTLQLSQEKLFGSVFFQHILLFSSAVDVVSRKAQSIPKDLG